MIRSKALALYLTTWYICSGVGELGGNFGTGERARISKPTPIIYSILNIMFTYSYTVLCVYIHSLLSFTNKYCNFVSFFGFWAEFLSKNMCIFRQRCQKKESYIYQRWKFVPVIYTFIEKGGLLYTWQRWKMGAIRQAHPYYVIYR